MISDVLFGLIIFYNGLSLIRRRRGPTEIPVHLESDGSERIHHWDPGSRRLSPEDSQSTETHFQFSEPDRREISWITQKLRAAGVRMSRV